jgi:hypothetical protein
LGSDLDGLSDNDGDAADAEATVTESSDLDFSPPASEEESDEEDDEEGEQEEEAREVKQKEKKMEKSEDISDMSVSSETPEEPVLLKDALPDGHVICDAPPMLDRKLGGKKNLFKFKFGWQCGKIRNVTRKKGFKYVVQWDDEATQHHKRLSLDAYSTSGSSQRFSWCVVAAQAIIWESSGGRRGRKSKN